MLEPQTGQNNSKRYQALILSIGVFLVLIVLLMLFTFYTSHILERNRELIGETSRTSNAAQAVIKDLFDLQINHSEDPNSPHMQQVLQRLNSNTEIIDKTLPLLKDGGVLDFGDSSVTLPAATSDTAKQSASVAIQEWSQLGVKIKDYLQVANDLYADSQTPLIRASEQAKISSLRINESLDALVAEAAGDAETQARLIRLIQIVGIVAIFAYFLIFIFFFLRRLRQSDEQVLNAQRETAEIMQTVSTGLFLLDKDLNIGQQHSQALESIVGATNLAGENLTSVLKNRISDKDLDTTRQFITQLYNPKVKEKLVNSLNPLNRVAFNSDNKGSRYLDFKFSRVYEGDKIARILVNVEDVSDAVRLEKRLAQERAQNDLQIDMLTTILNVSPDIIQNFINTTKARIEHINDILKSPGSTQFGLEGKLKSIYREMHSLKGEASALKLHGFTKIATDAENKLTELQDKERLAGNDFLPLTVHLDSLLELSGTIAMLGERIQGAVRGNIESANAPSASSTATTQRVSQDFYQDFIRQISERQGKLCKLDDTRYDATAVPSAKAQLIQDIIIQLMRNAVVHGIECPDVRAKVGKDESGVVKLFLQSEGDGMRIIVEDDGRGIDENAIRETMLASGKYDASKVAALSKRQLIGMLFTSGFSTKAHADEDGGRGVGLDVVKELVAKQGGKIDVQTEVGRFTRFIVVL